MPFVRGLLVPCLAAVLAAPPAMAKADPATDPAAELGAVQEQLQGSQAQQTRLSADIAAAAKARDAVSAQLVDVSQRIQASEAAIAAAQDDLDRLAKEQVSLQASLGEKQEALSELLAGLQRLQQDPPPALLVEPGDVLSALRGAMVFGAVVPDLRGEAEALADDLRRLDQVKSAVAAKQEQLKAEFATLTADRADLDKLIDEKNQLIDAGNSDLAAERARAAGLAAKATSLKQLMADLAKSQAAAEAARKAQAAALETPRMAFTDARGKLAFPVQGQILKRFGDDDGLGGTLQGTVLATAGGAQVTAPADGKIEFAGPFRSYGQLVILNPGSGYLVLLAGLGRLSVRTGDFLRAGEPVGQMGSGPSSVTLLGDLARDKRPVLYIEFRNNTNAVDSTPWWIGGSKEARG